MAPGAARVLGGLATSRNLPFLIFCTYLEDEAGEVDALVELLPLELVLVELLFDPDAVPADVLHTVRSIHSCVKGSPYILQSCRSNNRTWCNRWFSRPFVSDNAVRALEILASSDSENQTGGLLGYVSWNKKNKTLLSTKLLWTLSPTLSVFLRKLYLCLSI